MAGRFFLAWFLISLKRERRPMLLKSFRALALSIFLTSVIPISATAGDGLWSRIVSCRASLLTKIFSVNQPPPQRISDLHPLVQKWLRTKQLKLTYSREMKLAIGQTIVIEDRSYPIVARLGFGSEGAAYLVSSNRGLLVVKQFHSNVFNDFTMAFNFAAAKKRLPKILAADDSDQIILIEYFEGVPVNEILNDEENLIFSPTVRETVSHRWKKWKSRNPNYSDVSANAVYSFKDDKLRPIDGR